MTDRAELIARAEQHMDVWRSTTVAAGLARDLIAALKASEARVGELEKALTGLTQMNEDYSPFGGELMQDRIDRVWRNDLAALKGGDA